MFVKKLSGILTLLSLLPEKTPCPALSSEDGNVMVVSPVFANALFPIRTSPSWRLTALSFVQSSNAKSSMFVTEAGIIMELNM